MLITLLRMSHEEYERKQAKKYGISVQELRALKRYYETKKREYNKPKADKRTAGFIKWLTITTVVTTGFVWIQEAENKLQQSWKGGTEIISIEPECKSDVDDINDFFSDRHGGLDWDTQAHNMETCIK